MKIYRLMSRSLKNKVAKYFPDLEIEIEDEDDGDVLVLAEYAEDLKKLPDRFNSHTIAGIGIMHPFACRGEKLEADDNSDGFTITWDPIINDMLKGNQPWDKATDALARRLQAMINVHGYLSIADE